MLYRREQTELALFSIQTFPRIAIRNSGASPLATTTRIIQELVLLNSSSLYGMQLEIESHPKILPFLNLRRRSNMYIVIRVGRKRAGSSQLFLLSQKQKKYGRWKRREGRRELVHKTRTTQNYTHQTGRQSHRFGGSGTLGRMELVFSSA